MTATGVVDRLARSLGAGGAFLSVLASYEQWLLRERPRHLTARRGVRDIELFSHDYGTGQPVVLLHGGFTIAEAWAGQIPGLASEFRVIAPDTRGHGRTTLGTRSITYEQLAADVIALLETLDVGPAHLVGWSDGGCTSLQVALDRPDLVERIALLGTPYDTSNYTTEAQAEIETFLSPHSPEYWAVRLGRRVLTPEPGSWREFHARMRRLWTTEPDFSQAELGEIDAPTLVVGTDRDEFLSPADEPLRVFEDLADAIPDARLATIRGGTHEVLVEQPQAVTRTLRAFLRDVAG